MSTEDDTKEYEEGAVIRLTPESEDLEEYERLQLELIEAEDDPEKRDAIDARLNELIEKLGTQEDKNAA